MICITKFFIYFSGECKYIKNGQKELIEARILKTQYNLKHPLLQRKNKSFKKVSTL